MTKLEPIPASQPMDLILAIAVDRILKNGPRHRAARVALGELLAPKVSRDKSIETSRPR